MVVLARTVEPCVDNVACAKGYGWDSSTCQCVQCTPNAVCVRQPNSCTCSGCTATVFCTNGNKWDTSICECVPPTTGK